MSLPFQLLFGLPWVLLLFGLACFAYYLRGGPRWVWVISVLTMSVAITWIWMLLG